MNAKVVVINNFGKCQLLARERHCMQDEQSAENTTMHAAYLTKMLGVVCYMLVYGLSIHYNYGVVVLSTIYTMIIHSTLVSYYVEIRHST